MALYYYRRYGKFKVSGQGRDLAPFVGNGTKVKIPYEIKPLLSRDHLICICLSGTLLYDSKIQIFQPMAARLVNVDCRAVL